MDYIIKSRTGFSSKNYIKKKYRDGELSEQDIERYSDLFKLSITVLNRKKEICIKGNIFKYIRDDILTQKEGNLIKISGPDGTGKSTFLSILYIYLYKNFIANKFPFYPYYINLHFYDNIINEEPSEDIIKETMYKDLKKLKELVDVYPDMSYIIIIDGNENYFKTTLKSGKYFNLFIKDIYAHKKIVCIGEKTKVHIYRGGGPNGYMYERMQYLFKFRPISRYDKEAWREFVDVYSTVEKREGLFEQINQYLEIFDLDEVDYNILNVFRECYDNDILGEVNSLCDLYKNYCMAYLKDADDFEHCAKMSYEYFMTNKRFTQSEIANNSSEWNLIHQHKTISNFLIAYYYVKKVKDFIGEEDMGALEFLFPMDVNIFIKPLINDKHETQKLIFEKCKQIYEKGRILAKSQSLYMMGRITYKNLRSEMSK